MATGPSEPPPDRSEPSPAPRQGNDGAPASQALVAGIAQFLNVSDSAGNAVAANLTTEHVSEMISQNGRRSDQSYSLKKWGIAFAAFVVLVIAGIIALLTILGETQLLGEILFGIGGLISGLFGGFSGGYFYANSRQR